MSHVPPPEESKLEEKTFGESESPGQEDAAPSTTQSNIIEEIQEPSRRIVEESQHVLAQLSPARNNFLLVIFSIAQFIVCSLYPFSISEMVTEVRFLCRMFAMSRVCSFYFEA